MGKIRLLLFILLGLIGAQTSFAQDLIHPIEDAFLSKNITLGSKIFNRDWVAFPGRNPLGDGLGPVFNRVSCTGCHFKAGRGRPPEDEDEPFTSMILRVGFTDELGSRAHKNYGDQINDRAIPNVPAEARPHLIFEKVNGQYVDGTRYELRMPRYYLDQLNFGKIGWGIKFSGRVSQHLFGIGYLEAIPEADILAQSDPDDEDGNGISGRAAQLIMKDGTARLGRFGWKASKPDLLHQTAQALHQDMGLTNPLHPDQNCQWEQLACRTVAKQQGVEVGGAQLDQLVEFQRALEKPASDFGDGSGYTLFVETGCADCHKPSWLIPENTWPVYLAGKEIFPFTDMLLHDLGEGLSDGLFQGDASPTEWRTAPLWGVGQKKPLRLLHDGRARNVAEAILWHDGEGRKAKEAFRALSAEARKQLTDFVEGL